MDKVYIIVKYENEKIQEIFKGKDIVSVDDLLNKIDELLYEVEYLKEKIEDKEA